MAAVHPAITPGVSAQTLALTFHQMQALLAAGVPLDDALGQSAETGPWHFRRAMASLAAYVRDGHPLSEGMRHYGALFHPVIPSIVGAGERSGNLDFSFGLLTQFFEAEAQLKRMIQSAMIMPTITVFVAIIAVGILSWINFMPSTWAVRLIWVLVIAGAVWLLLRFRTVQTLARYLMMLVPYFNTIMQQLAVARFCQTFGLLIRAGVPYLEGLQSTLPVVQHPVVGHAAAFVYSGVRNGNTVEESIRSQRAFPPIVHSLVGAGEVAGSLDESLLKAAEYLRNEAEYKIKNSAKMVGPFLTIILGLIVLLILISFWQSYFKMIMGVMDE